MNWISPYFFFVFFFFASVTNQTKWAKQKDREGAIINVEPVDYDRSWWTKKKLFTFLSCFCSVLKKQFFKNYVEFYIYMNKMLLTIL